MGVCRGLWWDVGACWSFGSCGVSGGLAGADGAGGLSLGVGAVGLGGFCSRSFGSFFTRGRVAAEEEEDEEEGWLI